MLAFPVTDQSFIILSYGLQMTVPRKCISLRRGEERTSVERTGGWRWLDLGGRKYAVELCGSDLSLKLLFMVPGVRSQQPQMVTLLSY